MYRKDSRYVKKYNEKNNVLQYYTQCEHNVVGESNRVLKAR